MLGQLMLLMGTFSLWFWRPENSAVTSSEIKEWRITPGFSSCLWLKKKEKLITFSPELLKHNWPIKLSHLCFCFGSDEAGIFEDSLHFLIYIFFGNRVYSTCLKKKSILSHLVDLPLWMTLSKNQPVNSSEVLMYMSRCLLDLGMVAHRYV